MNTESVRPMPRLPLPRGPEHQAWVVDLTPPAVVRQTWTPSTAPYRYTPAGVWVRLAMPDNGVILAPRLLTKLADYVMRMDGDIHDELRVPHAIPAADVAQLLLAKALVGPGTSFVVVNIEPSGRVWFFYRLRRSASWHPDAPRTVV